MNKYKRQNTIAVDVDGTLQINGEPNHKLIAWLREQKADGFHLILWSSRGKDNATHFASLFGVADLFDVICSKPGYIVDDKGWTWARFTKIIRTFHRNNEEDEQN